MKQESLENYLFLVVASCRRAEVGITIVEIAWKVSVILSYLFMFREEGT